MCHEYLKNQTRAVSVQHTHSLCGDKCGPVQPSDKNKNALCQYHTVRTGVGKGEAEGVHTGCVMSLNSAGLQLSVTNYHIQRLFSCLAPLSTKCYTGKNKLAGKNKTTRKKRTTTQKTPQKNPTGGCQSFIVVCIPWLFSGLYYLDCKCMTMFSLANPFRAFSRKAAIDRQIFFKAAALFLLY